MSLLRNNLLKIAHRLIPSETIKFEKWIANTVVNGEVVPSYDTPRTIRADVHPLKSEMYEKLGLDFQKEYRLVHADLAMKGVDDQKIPDRMIYDNSYWNVQKSNNWTMYDGWSWAVFVRVKNMEVQPEPVPPTPPEDNGEE